MLANDLREDGFTVVSLDTGWVRTETGNTTEVLGKSPPLDVLTSVAGALHHLLRSVSCLPTFIYNKYQNQWHQSLLHLLAYSTRCVCVCGARVRSRQTWQVLPKINSTGVVDRLVLLVWCQFGTCKQVVWSYLMLFILPGCLFRQRLPLWWLTA